MNEVHSAANETPILAVPPAVVVGPNPRLWPGVAIVAIQWLLIVVPGWIAYGTMAQFMGWFLGPVVATAGLLVWWLTASRVPRADRWLAVLACVPAATVASVFGDPSMGPFVLILYVLPLIITGWVGWLVFTPFLPWRTRNLGLAALLIVAWSSLLLLRNDGPTGSFAATFRFRWTPTGEERFLEEVAAGRLGVTQAGAVDDSPAVLAPGDWPGFRGANRDGRLTGVRIARDWNTRPPKQLWRHRVGPGWSSFAVVGNRLYTQEQRGDDEAVVCYRADTGSELWTHRDTVRFTEVLAGPGPRATPTFHDGKLYTQGAAGRLNCLDAVTGKVQWSRDIAADSGAKVPQWGFAASPLIVQGVVTVFTGGEGGKSVLGYDASSGELKWAAGEGKLSYSSLQPATLNGVEQLLINTERGLTAFHPTRGEVLWQHDWPLEGNMARVVQPTILDDGDVLIGTSFGVGTRRVHVRPAKGAWTAEEVWTSRAIKPYFNDMVTHRGHLFGFDGNYLTCVNLDDGKKVWKERGYGNGQVLLLADQDLLLVLSEKGEAALVEARPTFKELGRFQAIDGKTWNHPVVAHGMLFVRNGEEAACYELRKDTAE